MALSYFDCGSITVKPYCGVLHTNGWCKVIFSVITEQNQNKFRTKTEQKNLMCSEMEMQNKIETEIELKTGQTQNKKKVQKWNITAVTRSASSRDVRFLVRVHVLVLILFCNDRKYY